MGAVLWGRKMGWDRVRLDLWERASVPCIPDDDITGVPTKQNQSVMEQQISFTAKQDIFTRPSPPQIAAMEKAK